jgi:hypothetical protein
VNVAIPTVYSKLGWREYPMDKDELQQLDVNKGIDYVFEKNGKLMTVQERFRELKYKNYSDFTVRYRRDGNYHLDRVKSEFYKIEAHYFTYGITNCNKYDLGICSQFVKVAIINLEKVFDKIDSGDIIIRNNGKRTCYIENGKLICPVIPNHDGSSSFVPFDIPMLIRLWGEDLLVYSKGFL